MYVLRRVLFALTIIAAPVLAHASADWAPADSYGRFQVVVADSASDSEKYAAEEFKKYWKLTTGRDIPVLDKPADGMTVWIGRDGVPDNLLSKLELEGLGTDGLCIRTLGPEEGFAERQLLIVGGRERGTMYGVYEFFERCMGVRWLTAGVTHIPEVAPASLPRVDYRYVPQLLRRQTHYAQGVRAAGHPEEAAAIERVQRLSPHVKFGLFVHTSFTILPPEKYFADHPEYYAEINGKRVAPLDITLEDMVLYPHLRSQLCYSNPEVAEAIVAELLPRMRTDPSATVWSVSQMDWLEHCECADCRAIDEREGTPMGSLLTCINRVADAIKEEFPDNYIETLAYQYTRKPPKKLRPRDNVIISLCNIECDFLRPMIDKSSAVNRAFCEDIRGWSKIPCTKFFWDYPDNVILQAPSPNFHVMQPNMQLWADCGFVGAYYCSNPNPTEEFGALKAYLLAKLMWNPYCDFDKLKEEFITLYYEEGAPYITEYIDLLTQTLRKKDVEMNIFDTLEWVDFDLVTQSDAIFQRAFAAVRAPEVTLRLRQEYASVQFQAMIAAPKLDLNLKENRLTVMRPPCLGLNQYIDLLHELGVPELHGKTHRENVEAWVGKALPPRQQESRIEVLENEATLLWVTPALQGSIVRWYDKSTGLELLDDIRSHGQAGHLHWHTWQDWVISPESPPEHPIAEEYDVTAKKANSITLETVLSNGLILERRIRLVPGTREVEVTLSVSNPTNSPVVPKVKLHPEFYTQDASVPEIWACASTGWTQLNGDVSPDLNAFGALVDPKPYVRWAAYIPKRGFTIVNEFNARELGSLFYFYNAQPSKRHVNLEILMKQEPLEAGGRRAITARYFVAQEHPMHM